MLLKDDIYNCKPPLCVDSQFLQFTQVHAHLAFSVIDYNKALQKSYPTLFKKFAIQHPTSQGIQQYLKDDKGFLTSRATYPERQSSQRATKSQQDQNSTPARATSNEDNTMLLGGIALLIVVSVVFLKYVHTTLTTRATRKKQRRRRTFNLRRKKNSKKH